MFAKPGCDNVLQPEQPECDNVLQPEPQSKAIRLQHIITRGLGKHKYTERNVISPLLYTFLSSTSSSK